jgi:phytanoyl-CoA hydroxylase
MRELILDPRVGEMAATLAGVDGLRVWHDQALMKQPWANPTAFHLDTPLWSFFDRKAISIWIALDDATPTNGCLYLFPGSHLRTTFDNPGITKNLDAVFEMYPEFRTAEPFQAAMPAGACSFHNGMTIHGAGANMTHQARRAMTCAFMPAGAVFNGIQNILTDEQVAALEVGDPLADDAQNPLVYPAVPARV